MKDGDPVHADLMEIGQAGAHGATLVRQLLAFSRQQFLAPVVVSVSAEVRRVQPMCERLIGADIALVARLAEREDAVRADAGQLQQVLVNLVINARDAMPRGGTLTLEVETIHVEESPGARKDVDLPAGAYVRLTVRDTGVGLDARTRAQAFEPFFTTKGATKGTGLGLATVYGIVTQSDGFIFVDSAVGQGTTFRVNLPQVAEEVTPPHPPPNAKAGSGTVTLLFVDDNAGLCRLAARMLAPTGHTVLMAASGEEALDVLAGHDGPIHLLLTDLVMPGMHGAELARRVKEHYPGIAVIYMTGYTDDEVVRRGMVTGTVPLLNKPFTAQVFLDTIRRVLDSSDRPQ